eukprot:TRINITY_DN793_c0_g1_i36.p1 TRINITY_DN793_c0_g1~~TRINITY_DN793_c0_g1_i36.p1  ORF type:complete len:120 (+),score=16.36 TRINITY_DN793_c0_g1_i36:26-385(+)
MAVPQGYTSEPCPSNIEDYERLAENCLRELQEHLKDSSWLEINVSIDGVKLYKKYLEGSYDLPLLRVEGELPAPPEESAKFLNIATAEERAAFDEGVKFTETLQSIFQFPVKDNTPPTR